MSAARSRTSRRSAFGVAIVLASASCVPNAKLPAAASATHAADTAARATAAPSALLLRPPAGITAATPPLAAAPPFRLASVAKPQDAARAAECLTAAVYYEARSEPRDGQRAVAQVVLNRLRNPAFPASVCGVVYQRASTDGGCQFSFACDGSTLLTRDTGAWRRAAEVARRSLAGDVYAPAGAATFYHATSVSPWWASSLTKVTAIGAHVFYQLGRGWGGALDFRQAYAAAEPRDPVALGDRLLPDKLMRYVSNEVGVVTVHRGATAGAGVVVHRGELPEVAARGRDEGASVRVHVGSAPVLDATPITAG